MGDEALSGQQGLSFLETFTPYGKYGEEPFRPVPEVVSSVSGSVASELTNPECSGRTGAIPPEIGAAL